MQRRNLTALTAGVVAFGISFSGAAHASLIGDETRFEYSFPDEGAVIFDNTIVVAPDSSDAFNFFNFATFDMGAEWLDVTFNATSFWTEAPFNGFRWSDLDWVDNGPGRVVDWYADFSNQTLEQEWLDNAVVGFGDDFISVDWGGMNFQAGDTMRLNLVTEHQETPEPGSVFSLIALGMGTVAMKRKLASAANR